MKICENCGMPLGDDHSFAVCPRCLFGEALDPVHPPAGTGRFRSLRSRGNFFEKYEILEKVGGGGQGEVWKVWDHEFRRHVAMKRLGPRGPHREQAAYRFLAEAQITSQLEHPGILPVFDVGLEPDGKLFYTTQLLPGTTLQDVWSGVWDPQNGGWTLNQALELLLRVCEIVAHAHSRGVIHRDLKPANVLVGAFGEVRVIDWGSAHVLAAQRRNFEEPFVRLNDPPIQTDRNDAIQDDPGSPQATANSGQALTVEFAAPELLLGDTQQLGPRTDIYSLGVMLYQLLAGRLPYPDPAPLRERIAAGPPPRLRSFKPAVSRDLAAICERAMAHDRLDRYHSATELAGELRAVLEFRPVQARHPGPWLILQKWARRNISYVLTGSLSLVIIAIVLSFAHAFKAERDSALQIQALRSAELASRSGHWREAIADWDEARADGYRDTIFLDLQKAEAWTVLNEPDRAKGLLTALAARSDLGGQRGVVLLRLGDYYLSDRTTAIRGERLVNEAIKIGLTNADLLFARGLLADATPEALDLFHQALRYDPYHYGAQANSLGLEVLLGRRQELANHLAVFKILYPDDPSPDLIAAIESAMGSDLAGSQTPLARLRNQVNSNFWEKANVVCGDFAEASKIYDVDVLLRQRPPQRTPLEKLRTDPLSAGALMMPGEFSGVTNWGLHPRVPWMPCIQQGPAAGFTGLAGLLRPYGDPLAAVQEIESSWQHHPEALVPVLGGMLLENRQPQAAPPLPGIMQIQARLYQMGADSAAFIPQVARLGRYLATRTEFELIAAGETNSAFAATNCVANIRTAAAAPETSAAECQAYFEFALNLRENDLALELINRLEKLQPDDPATRRDRIQVDLALGAFGQAMEMIDQLLAANPNDPWALARRRAARAGVKTLTESIPVSLQLKP